MKQFKRNDSHDSLSDDGLKEKKLSGTENYAGTSDGQVSEQLQQKLAETLLALQVCDKHSTRWKHLSNLLVRDADSLVQWRVNRRCGAFIQSHKRKTGDDIAVDLTNEAWAKIFSDLIKFDPSKGTASAFLIPRIDQGAQQAIYNITGVSQYYTENKLIISKAIDALKELGITPSVEAIHLETGLSLVTIKRTLAIIDRQFNTMSYDSGGYDDDGLEEGRVGFSGYVQTVDTLNDYMRNTDVNNALQKLPPLLGFSAEQVREAVVLRYECEESTSAVSEKLGANKALVHKMLIKARSIMKELLSKEGYGVVADMDALRYSELNNESVVPLAEGIRVGPQVTASGLELEEEVGEVNGSLTQAIEEQSAAELIKDNSAPVFVQEDNK